MWKPNPNIIFEKIPYSLYGITPRSVMPKGWWADQKKEAKELSNNYCHCCGVHVSEAKYFNRLEGAAVHKIHKNTCEVEFVKVVALCYLCNAFKNLTLTRLSFDKGVLSEERMADINSHGIKVQKISDSFMDRKSFIAYSVYEKIEILTEIELMSNWTNWTYCIHKIRFKSRFNNFEEWLKVYSTTKKV